MASLPATPATAGPPPRARSRSRSRSRSYTALAASLPHHDDAPLPLRGGALASLIQTRSAASPLAPSPFGHYPHGEDEVTTTATSPHDHLLHHMPDDDDAAVAAPSALRRPAADERRLGEIINRPQMRSMRLIGQSNPRYQWERYWKTDGELKKMTKGV
jgi:hypothetical protein